MNTRVVAPISRARFLVLCDLMDAISGETPKECRKATHTVFNALSEAIAAARANGTADPETEAMRRATQTKLKARCALCANKCKAPLA